MRQAILDSDIVSYIIDSRVRPVLEAARQYQKVFRYFSFSSITVTEVLRGLRSSNNYKEPQNLLRS